VVSANFGQAAQQLESASLGRLNRRRSRPDRNSDRTALPHDKRRGAAPPVYGGGPLRATEAQTTNAEAQHFNLLDCGTKRPQGWNLRSCHGVFLESPIVGAPALGGHMTKSTNGFPTPIQNIALNLIFAVMGECRFNRTAHEYADIAARLPALKMLVFKVNEYLKGIHRGSRCSGIPLPQICRFQAGDERWDYEDYPAEISHETVRTALIVSGLRSPRLRKRKHLQ
jgi:hypothetical protein